MTDEIHTTATHQQTGRSSRLAAYALVLIPFAVMVGTSAFIVQSNLAGYLLLVSAFLSGVTIAGVSGATWIYNSAAHPWLNWFFTRLPGWNAIHKHCRELAETVELLEVRHQTLTDNIAAAIIIRDAGGTLLYCSPYIEVLTGYSQEEIYDSASEFFTIIVHQDDREKVNRSLRVSQFGEAFQFRFRFYHKTGLLMWAETRTVPLLDENGTLHALLSITFDVTGSMRYQEKVEEHNQDLQDFSFMLSHDLKGPMETIRGMLFALREDFGTELPEGADTFISHAERASERLQSLVASVIEYSRVSNLEEQQRPVDCAAVVADVTREMSIPFAKSGTEIAIESLPRVWGDATMLYQIFLNLFSNSVKYRDPERPLRISVHAHIESDERTVSIAVVDTGRGVPPDRIDDIFRPFHRAHGKEIEGSGIGLACVKKLTERIGGTITVSSDGETGARFVLRLRLADDAAGAPLA